MQKLVDYILAKWRSLDPKLLYGAVTFVLTYLVADVLGLSTDDVIAEVGAVKVTWTVAIAFVAAQVVAYRKENDGTLLREGILDDGNPEFPDPDVGVKTPRNKAA